MAHDGFLPNGVVGLCAGLLMVIFAFGGIEIVAIAAAESDDPRTSIRKAVRGVLFRVLVFYVGSALVMVSVLPWYSPELAASPFVAVLTFAHIPWIDSIMALVVVIALLSAMNANIYAASRMLLSLSERGIAPRVIQVRNRNKTPYVAVSASVILCTVAVVMNYLAPDLVMPMLLNAVGSTLLVTWGFIALSQLILRIRADKDPSIHLPVRMPGFPYLSILALVMLAGIVVLALFDPASRTQLLATLGLTVAIGVLNALAQRRSRRLAREAEAQLREPADGLRPGRAGFLNPQRPPGKQNGRPRFPVGPALSLPFGAGGQSQGAMSTQTRRWSLLAGGQPDDQFGAILPRRRPIARRRRAPAASPRAARSQRAAPRRHRGRSRRCPWRCG